jgi:hypothetical protein
MDVYLDTNLWNELFKQRVQSDRLLASLGAKGARLVVSDEAIYELAKTFIKGGETGAQEGSALFTYLKGFISGAVPIAKDPMALVAAEMQALQWMIKDVFPFVNGSDYEIVRSLVDHLSVGEISEDDRARTTRRLGMRDEDRRGIKRFQVEFPDSKADLRSVSPEAFPAWLAKEAATLHGTEYLARQIHGYYSEQPAEHAWEYARALQTTMPNRVSKGMIRRNIYLNWRCARRNSIPKDLFPDSAHIVNANYCDVYATKESGQIDYAPLLLTPLTRVHIYDSSIPVDDWLLALN